MILEKFDLMTILHSLMLFMSLLMLNLHQGFELCSVTNDADFFISEVVFFLFKTKLDLLWSWHEILHSHCTIIVTINCLICSSYRCLKLTANFNYTDCQNLKICSAYRAVSLEFSFMIFLISILKKLTLMCSSVYFYSCQSHHIISTTVQHYDTTL